eukprot:g4663.t1
MVVRREPYRQIVGYSTDSVTTLAFIKVAGSVMNSRFIWLQMLLLGSFSLSIWAYGTVSRSFDKLSVAPLDKSLTFMNGLCTFILSLFISLTLARWWAVRKECVGELWNCATEISILASSYLSEGKEKAKLRDRLIRYSLLSHALIFQQARGRLNSTFSAQDYESMLRDGLVTDAEVVALSKVAVKAEAPWVWSFQLVSDAVERGLLPAALRYDFHSRILRGEKAVNLTFAYVNTNLPLIYVQLVVLLVKLTMIMWSLKTGITMAKAFDDQNVDTGEADIFPALINQLVMPVVYQSALELHRKLHNPFLEHSSGLPEHTFQSAMRKQCADIIEMASFPRH